MRYRYLLTLFFAAFAVESYASDTLVCKVDRSNNWAFYGSDRPEAIISLVNKRQVYKKFDFRCDIRDAQNRSIYELSQSGVVAPSDSAVLSFTFKTVAPGFYDMSLYNDDRFIEEVVIAYEPHKIGAQNGGKENFIYFAHKVALERREIKPQFAIVRNRAMSGRERNVYDFSMVSSGDERVNGYIAFPKGKRGLKAMVTLVQEEKRNLNPLADFTAPNDFVELVLYTKARGIGEEIMKNYLTDMLLAIDFLSLREEVDKSGIYVQGAGYTGACAFVSSAMTDAVAGSIAAVPDFTLLTDKFSVESIADNVSSPLLLGTGLQRDVGFLEEIFSIYNKVKGVKEYFVNPRSDEIERNRWKYIKEIYIKRISD